MANLREKRTKAKIAAEFFYGPKPLQFPPFIPITAEEQANAIKKYNLTPTNAWRQQGRTTRAIDPWKHLLGELVEVARILRLFLSQATLMRDWEKLEVETGDVRTMDITPARNEQPRKNFKVNAVLYPPL